MSVTKSRFVTLGIIVFFLGVGAGLLSSGNTFPICLVLVITATLAVTRMWNLAWNDGLAEREEKDVKCER